MLDKQKLSRITCATGWPAVGSGCAFSINDTSICVELEV
jgi:hypothetical protein